MTSLSQLLIRLLCLSCMALPLASQAQVQRCTDAQGHVTYTDGPCSKGEQTKEVVPALTPEEKARQEAAYEEALARRREEQALQAQRDTARRTEMPPPPPQYAPSPAVPAPAATEPTVIYRPYYPQPALPPVHPPPPGAGSAPQPAVNCNVFRCYDGSGNSWTRP